MKLTKIIAILLSVLLLSGCGANVEKPNEVQREGFTPYTVTDMTGREVTFDKPVERIVCLSASDCEIIYALGAGDLLVGRDSYSDYPAEVLELPALESGNAINIEEVIALEPQLLIMADMLQTEDQIKQLESAGCKIILTDPHDLEGVYKAIEVVGAAIDRSDMAASLVNTMQDGFDKISKEVPETGAKTIYFEVSPLEYGLWTAGAKSFMDEIATIIGCKNCFYDVDDWAQISQEQVIERDPDYILTITMDYGDGPSPVEEIMSRPGWENITAVKNGDILNLTSNELSRPGPRLLDGAQMLYDFINE